ncbi:hypothetical protein SBV1_3090002 [Verrucomicrobia bacterium]|nr:hypothetical protein SBV1_3090002 [Verrucomicrobiota bacterium]
MKKPFTPSPSSMPWRHAAWSSFSKAAPVSRLRFLALVRLAIYANREPEPPRGLGKKLTRCGMRPLVAPVVWEAVGPEASLFFGLALRVSAPGRTHLKFANREQDQLFECDAGMKKPVDLSTGLHRFGFWAKALRFGLSSCSFCLQW